MFHKDAAGMQGSFFSRKDFDSKEVAVLRDMYMRSLFYPYLLQYGSTARALSDMGDLLFREARRVLDYFD